MISRKARNRKKVISFVMRLVVLIKPGSLSHFQIKIMRLLVLFASFRRANVNNVVVKKISLDQLELYRIIPNKISDKVKILFFHGGGFFVGNFKIYRSYASFLAEILGREIIFVEYKLSPESKYPSQLEDAKKAYSFLLGKKEKSNIILAGDSAGGNLALALFLALKKDKSKKPKGIFCISPWVYPTAIMAEYPDSCCQSDVLIGPFIKRAKETGSGPLSYLYCNPSDHKNPRPLLLNCYTSADAKAYTPHPQPTVNTYKIVRGEQVKWAHHDPRPCQMPPDWSGGYTSIYAAQAGEDKA